VRRKSGRITSKISFRDLKKSYNLFFPLKICTSGWALGKPEQRFVSSYILILKEKYKNLKKENGFRTCLFK
jgi:hypothetical protein